MPSGVRMPWLIALFRNRILAGSISSEARGSSELSIRNSTAAPAPAMRSSMIGASRNMEAIAMIAPMMPAEKLLTSISKPVGMRGTAH